MRVYSHSYWLVIFCTTNSSRVLARRERWQTFDNSWKNTIFNEQPVYCILWRKVLAIVYMVWWRDYVKGRKSTHNVRLTICAPESIMTWKVLYCCTPLVNSPVKVLCISATEIFFIINLIFIFRLQYTQSTSRGKWKLHPWCTFIFILFQ